MAQTAQSNQADLAEFTVSPDDFGQALINFVTFGSFKDFDTEAPSLMSTIGRVLSTISLFMMAGLAAVGSANYVIQTANKGVPGGQVISSFWMPLRISTATLLLIPLASGYSTIQSKVVYNVASTGNAHASYLATEGASYIIKHGAYKPPILADNAALVNGLIAAEICMAHVNASVGREVVKPVYKQYTGRTELSYDYKVIGGFRRSNYIPNYCGKVELAAPDAAYTGLKEDAIIGDSPSEVFSGSPKDTAQEWYQDYSDVTSRIMVKTFPAVIGALRADAAAIASNIIFDTKALVDLQQNGNEAGFEGMSTQAPANIAAGAELTPALYKKANDLVFSQIAEIINSVHGNPNRDETPLWVQELNKLGWTYLGTTYWQISKNQEEINNMARTLEFKYTEPLPDNEFQNDERFRTLSIRYRDMLALVSESGYKPQADSMKVFIDASGVSDAGNSGSGFYKKFIVGLSQSLMLSLTTSKDADMLVQLQQTGNYVGSFLDLAFHGAMWAKAMAAGVKAGADEAIDSVQDAANSNPLTGVLSLFATPVSSVGKGVAAFAYVIIVEYVELIKGIMPPLLIACFLLAIVLPTIPLFMWLMGIVSWIIFYIECLLISPIWLSAHGTAEKEGWGTEHTRQGYMLMIGLYLNPILRTAGFLAMVKLLYPLGVLIHWLSSYLVGVLVTGAVSSPLMIAGSMLILAFTGYSICMRVFSLPNELFERGLRWVNGGQEVTGDENGSNRINAMVANFGYKSESAMNGKNSSSPIGQNPDPKREKKD
tara:strand:- start:4990 stop:7302 length:2313 start_codon:yes stop_codon:yes gene_type:complete